MLHARFRSPAFIYKLYVGYRAGQYAGSKGCAASLEADWDSVKKQYFEATKKEDFGPQVSDVQRDFEGTTVRMAPRHSV
jgi:hypothetical protein